MHLRCVGACLWLFLHGPWSEASCYMQRPGVHLGGSRHEQALARIIRTGSVNRELLIGPVLKASAPLCSALVGVRYSPLR